MSNKPKVFIVDSTKDGIVSVYAELEHAMTYARYMNNNAVRGNIYSVSCWDVIQGVGIIEEEI